MLFAAIMNDMHRAAGRSGAGAVMGSKNLKAVAVRGTGAVSCADAAAFNRAVLDVREKIHAHPVGGTGLRLYGTDVLTNILNEIGGYPTRNFQDGHFPTADKIGGESLGGQGAAAAEGLLRLRHLVRPGLQGHRHEVRGRGRGPRVRDRLGLRRQLRASTTSMR